jgi:hypothetical protein
VVYSCEQKGGKTCDGFVVGCFFFIYLFLHVDLNAAVVFEAVEISLLGWKLIMVAVAYEGVDGMESLSW